MEFTQDMIDEWREDPWDVENDNSLTLSWQCADEYGELYEDSESIYCPVESEDRGEYWGVPCSQDVVNTEPAVERAKEIINDIHDFGGKVFSMELDGESLIEVVDMLDEPNANKDTDEADFCRDEAEVKK